MSRVGGAAQIKPMKEVAGSLRIDLAQYRELAAFSQFASDLDAGTQQQLRRGARLTEVLKQGQYSPLPAEQQVVQILAGNEGLYDSLELPQVVPFANDLTAHMLKHHSSLLDEIAAPGASLKGGLKERVVEQLKAFKATYAV